MRRLGSLVAPAKRCQTPRVAGPCSRPVRIAIVDPEGRERSVTLKNGDVGPVTVGRAPENDIQLISPYISRRHAQIWPHDDGVYFEDLDSTSGSYMGGARVDSAVLGPGRTLHLGSPDGLPLTVEDLRAKAPASKPTRTEVLRVADIQESLYLTGKETSPNVTTGRRRTAREQRIEERLRALITLTGQLLEVRDLNTLADAVLERVFELLPVDRGMILIGGDDGLEPRVWGVQGQLGRSQPTLLGPLGLDAAEGQAAPFKKPELPFVPISTVTNRVFEEGVGLLSLDATSDERLEGSKSVVLQAVRSIMAAPISSAKRVYGVLYVDTHRSLRKEDEDALDWLVAAGRQAGMVLDNITLLEQQRTMMESMMRGLAASVDARDGMTAGHSARVAHYCVGTAQQLGMSVDEQYTIYYAGLLHDYGKIGVDDAVLKKPARLTPEEYKHIQLHPKFTFDILSKIDFPPHLENLPLMAASHHERWDGLGYPWGLAGEEIPVEGRIMAIADVYDSLTRKRHYRDPMPLDEVLTHLEEGRDTRFDPRVLDAFFAYHEQELAMREQRRRLKRQRHSSDSQLRAASEPTHAGLPAATLLSDSELAAVPGDSGAPDEELTTVRVDGRQGGEA